MRESGERRDYGRVKNVPQLGSARYNQQGKCDDYGSQACALIYLFEGSELCKEEDEEENRQ